uniref:Toll-like receptor2 n=1 Tax=Ciona intestinalis TaxID=7719 RepID=C9K4U9_CIOIN|nr:toll-like receptor 2 [Ciona intestinalis]BAI43698.1 Toll-like receptor2 [Ciona intestinalis]|eukprot:NP_001159600.1 toll-like receptor 2 [Ciona intestinalis]
MLSNGSCIVNPRLNMLKLFLRNLNYSNIPHCIPNSVTTMSLIDIPLTSFNKDINTTGLQEFVKWPESLEVLYIKNARTGPIGNHVFKNMPLSLRTLQISSCKIPWPRVSIRWPRNINHLTLIYCKVETTDSTTFKDLVRVDFLSMRGNLMTDVPFGLPQTTKTLDVSYNRMRTVSDNVWGGLNNLTKLYISNNQLVSIPKYLPSSLEQLNLKENQISYSDRDALERLVNLRQLDMSYNRLLNMPQGLPASSMRRLTLNNNEIGLIRSPADYKYCVNCSSISLQNNPWVCNQNLINMMLWLEQLQSTLRITLSGFCASIQTDLGRVELKRILHYMTYMASSFHNCLYDVQNLQCKNASLSQLPRPSPLGLLTVLVTNNKNLTLVPDNMFKLQNKLTSLNLESNGITRFPRGLPSSLLVIYLSYNKITAITEEDQSTLDQLVNLKQLYLSGNLIKILYDYQLQRMASLRWLALNNNPMECDCSMQSLSLWYIQAETTYHYTSIQRYLEPLCVEPPNRRNQRITTIFGAYYYEYNCIPRVCTHRQGNLDCSYTTQQSKNRTRFNVLPTIPRNTYWLTLDLSNLQLENEKISLTQLTRLTTLNLTGNKLTSIPLQGLPRSIENINLSRNKISTLPATTLITCYLPNLKQLDLRNNSFSTIQTQEVSIFLAVTSVLLKGNPLECNCKLRPLITWIQTNEKNEQDLSTHDLKDLICFTPKRFEGRFIINLSESEYCPVVNLSLIGGLVGGFTALLIIIIIIVNIYLYKKRKKQERRDIVQGFKDLLEKEAMNEGDPETGVGVAPVTYEYDAFVSYVSDSDDVEFVYKMLEEMEEKRERKMCIHERDFTPGRGIADNIVECISTSRRMVLVVSRKYASSAWCQYEVQIALTELHAKRRGRLLVPILLEDVTRDEQYAGSVTTILSAITAIQAPKAQDNDRTWANFWNKLDKTLT